MKIPVSKISFLYFLAFLLTGCATGSSILVGKLREATDPGQVQLFLEKPAAYEIIGIVKASSDAGWTEQDSVNYAVEELKNQAAKLGANGVLIDDTGENNSSFISGYGTGYLYAIPVTEQTVTGKAIYVKPSTVSTSSE